MKIEQKGQWVLYSSKQVSVPDTSGKWMYFFDDQSIAEKLCKQAIDENIVDICKHTDLTASGTPEGVICFYADGSNKGEVSRIVRWMVTNNLVRRTKAGKLYNISFKFDDQTRAGEYGAGYEGQIKLADIMDLTTGEFLS